MTGSPVRTAVGGGLVACGVLLTTVGGVFAAVAGAEPNPGAPPGQSTDTAPEPPVGATDAGQPQEHDPGTGPANGAPTDAKDDKAQPDGEADRAPVPGRSSHGWHPRPTTDPEEPHPGPGDATFEGHPLGDGPQHGQPGAPVEAPTTGPPAPVPVPGIAAAAQHLDPDPDDDDDDDDCGWPPTDPFWSWLISLFTPKPDTGTNSAGGTGGGGPPVPAARIPGSVGWPSPPDRLPPEGVDAPELGGVGADVEPPAAGLPPVGVPIPAPIVGPPPVGAHPQPGPAIAVPAKPNSTGIQHPPARPELPAKSPVSPGTPEGFRAGYATYLRSASIGEVAGLAALGVSGLAALTAVGGLIGFRQAKVGLAVKAVGTARFLQ